MQIKVVVIGKIKERYLREGIDDYKTRLSRFAKIEVVELPEEDIGQLPEREVKEREAAKIRKHLSGSWFIVALDREGEELSSPGLAHKIEMLMVGGTSSIAFVIGGPLGLAEEILKGADMRLSISKLTYTHQLARLLLLEQVYRSFKIIRGEPYHY
ncbi:MAG: 23S rRNA (pseudouridine(1915)-N(3))-methyltransferase RlmH [Candidatus Aquicultor primus]|uniref:Ribosomal RNA large subunit methyltransferase H n=1 Tax=Candidatus Aquicultor primus TaxID=1797195 RepID=A0A1F2UG43_9ACTN|nr:MAG: 23S rRNA (pseudouridine(1915)-N(3))-methyltransferase RlmH [Candidatus Aquicultor primus]